MTAAKTLVLITDSLTQYGRLYWQPLFHLGKHVVFHLQIWHEEKDSIYIAQISWNTIKKLFSSSLLFSFLMLSWNLYLCCLLQCQLCTWALEQTLRLPNGKTGLERAVSAALSVFLAVLMFNSMCIQSLPWKRGAADAAFALLPPSFFESGEQCTVTL